MALPSRRHGREKASESQGRSQLFGIEPKHIRGREGGRGVWTVRGGWEGFGLIGVGERDLDCYGREEEGFGQLSRIVRFHSLYQNCSKNDI